MHFFHRITGTEVSVKPISLYRRISDLISLLHYKKLTSFLCLCNNGTVNAQVLVKVYFFHNCTLISPGSSQNLLVFLSPLF